MALRQFIYAALRHSNENDKVINDELCKETEDRTASISEVAAASEQEARTEADTALANAVEQETIAARVQTPSWPQRLRQNKKQVRRPTQRSNKMLSNPVDGRA